MEKIIFITGNMNKLKEVRNILEDYEIDSFEYDIEEIQGDPARIVEDKALKAFEQIKKPLFVEDVNLCFDSLNGLPGPYIKDFLRSNSLERLYEIASKGDSGELNATAKCLIGFIDSDAKFHFIEGSLRGKIVKPKGKQDFGWDAIFMPQGFNKTYGEMDFEEKNQLSHRRVAFEKFKRFLDEKKDLVMD